MVKDSADINDSSGASGRDPEAKFLASRASATGLSSATASIVGDLQEFNELRSRLRKNKNDTEALERLRSALENGENVWRQTCDLTRKAAVIAIDRIRPHDPVDRSLLLRRMNEVRSELGYDKSPAVERLLIEHAASCGLHHQITLFVHSAVAYSDDYASIECIWEKRLEQATRRYERALQTLARVRKLPGNRPLLQLNVGAQQVITNA